MRRLGRTAWVLMVVAVLLGLVGPSAAVAAPTGTTFIADARLSGAEEVPSNASPAQGVAVFFLSPDGSTLRYTLFLTRLVNPTAAHIHTGAPGVNGGVVAFLCGGGGKPACPANGGVTGTITSANLTGTLAGQPLSALVAAMATGNTYTNAHTAALPGGEIRGQNAVRAS